MFLQLKNLVGANFKQEPGLPIIAEHADTQLFQDVPACWFDRSCGGPLVAKRLSELEAKGDIEHQFVADAWDRGVFVKKLVVSHAKGDFTAADVTQTFTDDVALPAGAILLGAYLEVEELLAGGAVATCIVKSGIATNDDAFDASEDVFTGAALTRRAATLLGIGGLIGGESLMLTVVTTVGNVAALTSGRVTLAVVYTLGAAL